VTKVLIADSQALAVAGIRYLLENLSGFTMIGSVNNWKTLIAAFQEDAPDLLLFDYTHLEGFSHEHYQQLHQHYPSTTLFAITADQNHQQILRILQANTTAFLTKECSQEEILTALRAVASGQKFYCETVLQLLMEQSIQKQTDSSENSISPRELQIIQYIAQELPTEAIANALNLSPHTINAHRKRILKKLNVKTPVGLVVKALRLQLIKL